MVFETKDFQIQAQWALVAIPAPIYRYGLGPRSLSVALTNSSPDRRYAKLMIGPRTFGKLGNRKMARLATKLDAGMVLHEGRATCRLENASRTGCCLQLAEPPRTGTNAIIRIAEIETFGTIAWVKGNRCGVTFDRPLSIASVERLRWLAEHSDELELAALADATAVWR